MLYRARKGTKVQVSKHIPWASKTQEEIYADRIAKLGDQVWSVDIAHKDMAAIVVDGEFVIVPKFTLDRAA